MFVLREICREVSAKFANVLVELSASNPSAAEQLKPFSVSDSAHICGWKRCYDHLNDKIVTAINNHSLCNWCVAGHIRRISRHSEPVGIDDNEFGLPAAAG
jgi:hypothetical protein